MMKKRHILSIKLALLLLFILWPSQAKSGIQNECTIFGIVSDKRDQPVKGAEIKVYCPENDFKKVVRTNKDGTYIAQNLTAGYYHVVLSKKYKYYLHQKRVLIGADLEYRIDFKHLRSRAAVYGHVFDLDGKPISECTVIIDNVRYTPLDASPRIRKECETDEQGFYCFEGVYPDLNDFTLNKIDVLRESPGGSTKLESGLAKEVTIRMQPGLLRGRVQVEKRGPMSPVYIKITVRESDKDYKGPTWTTSMESSKPIFEVNNLPAGSYEAEASLKGYYCIPVVFRVPKRGETKEITLGLKLAGSVIFNVKDRDGNPERMGHIFEVIRDRGRKRVPVEKLSEGVYRIYASPGRHFYQIGKMGKPSTKGSFSRFIEIKNTEEIVIELEF